MTRPSFLLSALAGLLISAGLAAPADADATFTDPGTFATSIWSKTILGGGDVVDTRQTSGGNPGDWLQLQTIPNGGDGADIVVGAFFDSAAVWNPSTQGAIDYVTMSIDKKVIDAQGFVHSQGQAIRIALKQDGQIFDDPFAVTGIPADWTSGSASLTEVNRTYSSFKAIDALGVENPSLHPDFTESGSPIEFGFDVANSGSAPISGTTMGYDNWNLSLITSAPTHVTSSVPDPGSLSLLGVGLGFVGLLWTRRRLLRKAKGVLI